MATRHKSMISEPRLNGWLGFALKSCVTVIATMLGFYVTTTGVAVNQSIATLDTTLRAIEKHLAETDKTLLEIKISRDENMPRWNAAMVTLEEMKKKLDILSLRTTTIEENLTRHKIY